MADSKPLASIGVPVYNGERFIRQTLDSLLEQDYENFELIISDNASTDRTAEIAQEYLAKGKRIRYSRNGTNIGAAKNFSCVVDLSSGKYFMWAADHDLWHPTFLSRCVSILETNPEVVLVYPRTMLIDCDGNQLEVTPDQIDTRGLSAFQCYRHLIFNLGWCNMVYGVIRREILSQTCLGINVLGWDHVLLADLALRGAFAQVAEPLFYRRQNRPDEDPETYKKRVLFYIDPISAVEKSKASTEDLYRELRNAHLRIVVRAPIGFLEKLCAAIATVQCFRVRFGVRSRSLLFAERIGKHIIPRKLRREIHSQLQRLGSHLPLF